MGNLIQLHSVRELRTYGGKFFQDGLLYVATGAVLNDVGKELQKGDEARWVLKQMVELGTDKDELRDQG